MAGRHAPRARVAARTVTAATRLAPYCARNPVATKRLTYARGDLASDKADGPTAGTEPVDPLEGLARVLVHIPDKGHMTTRYDGRYANRPDGMRGKAATAAACQWAALLQQIFERVPPATARGKSSRS